MELDILFLAGGSRGVLLPRVRKIRYFFCLENPFMARLFSSVTVIVFPYLWLGYNPFHPVSYCDTVRVCTKYVDSSYRSMSGDLLRIWHEDRSALGREAWGLVGGRSRDSRS